MRASFLAPLLLFVGLFMGTIAGFTVAPARTVTSAIPVTHTITATVTDTRTTTLERVATSTLTLPTTLTTTAMREVTVTAQITVWPKFSPEGKIGEDVGGKGLIFVIHSIEEKWKLGIFEPKHGNKFIVIDIEIKNVYPADKQVSTGFMYLVDEEGRRYGFSVAGVALTGYFPGAVTLKQGESVRGYVAFEVPQTSTPSYFIYEDLLERYASIALK